MERKKKYKTHNRKKRTKMKGEDLYRTKKERKKERKQK